jgi:amino acid transporter/nucleotide-binding universal stress UspA family protein
VPRGAKGASGAGSHPSPPEGETQVRLARDLTLADATLLGVGALVGGGIFVLPGIAAGLAGPAVFLALALNALVLVPTLLVYAELSSGRHDAGGGYLWIKDALQEPWGFLGGWMNWFAHAVACAVYALASAAYLLWLLTRFGILDASFAAPPWPNVTAVAITALFVGLNLAGAKQAVRAEAYATGAVLATLAVFVLAGLAAIVARPEGLGQLHLTDPAGLFPHGLVGVFLAMGLTVIAFEGFEIVAQAGEEVRRPERNIPRAVLLCVAIVSPLLVLVAVVSVAAITPAPGQESWQWLAERGELALVEAAGQFVPFGVGALLVLVGAMLSNITALNSTIFSSSRVSFAMGRDRVLPGFFARVHPRTQTPAASILFSGAIVAVMAALLPIQEVAAAAGVMFLMLMALVNVSALKLRHTSRHHPHGFRAPFFPWTPLLGIAAQVALGIALFLFSPMAWAAAAAWVALGLVVHYAYARKAAPAPEPRTSLAFEVKAAPFEGYHILLPVANPGSVAPLASVARDLARAKGGAVTLLHVITVPRTTLPSAVRHLAEPARPFLNEAMRQFGEVPVNAVVKIAHDPAGAILETAEEENSNLILLGWRGRPSLRENLLGATLDPVVREAPCDIAVLRDGRAGEPRRMLVAARGRGKHARLGAEVAAALARQRAADLVAVTVITPGAHPEPEARLASVIADAGVGPWEATFKTVRAASAEEGLLQATEPGDLLVLGASEEPAWRTTLFGTLPQRVAEKAEGSVLLVKRQTPAARAITRLATKARHALGYLKAE